MILERRRLGMRIAFVVRVALWPMKSHITELKYSGEDSTAVM